VAQLRDQVAGRQAGKPEAFDEALKQAALADAAEYAGEAVSAVERHRAGPGVHSWREGDLFTCMGWTRAQYPYYREAEKRGARWEAFGVERKMTPVASDTVSRLAATLGSFKEGRDTLERLGLGQLSVSKVRAETLASGLAALEAQKAAPWNKRTYTAKQRKLPKGGRRVPRTLVILVDGTCVPATRADTRDRKGKNGGEAGARQLRVVVLFEYEALDAEGHPVPLPGSFSYAVLLCNALELKGFVKKLGEARGARSALRVQCGADGEEALESILTDAFPRAVFFNDFMHAASYLSTACHAPGIPDPDKEFKTCRGIMKRHGAGAAVDRLKRLYADPLKTSPEASSALDYLEKRRGHMNYGWLRQNGYYIGTAHVEAAARLLVARRCKQAGMHWRVENAARVCALLASIRSTPAA
jgi:hypothetical protein